MNCDIIDINYNLKIRIMDYDKLDEVLKVSDPFLVARRLKKYYGMEKMHQPFIYLITKQKSILYSTQRQTRK